MSSQPPHGTNHAPPPKNTAPSAADIEALSTKLFQASNAFVSACQDATLAMYALTAKIKAMDGQHKGTEVPVKKGAKKVREGQI